MNRVTTALGGIAISELIETLRLVSLFGPPNIFGLSALPTPLEVMPPLMAVLPAMAERPAPEAPHEASLHTVSVGTRRGVSETSGGPCDTRVPERFLPLHSRGYVETARGGELTLYRLVE